LSKPKLGRPSIYNPEIHDKKAFRFALLGMTDIQIASAFEINQNTLNEWKTRYPNFGESLNNGKVDADGDVVESLYMKAVNGDTTAQIFWLKNRNRKNWKDKQEIDLDVSQAEKLSYPELILKLEELKKELEE
jgi:hypothetical protein